jgi:hypothetical protein
MKRRIPVGLVLAVLFTLANVAGGIYAGAMGEIRHAGVHFLLAVVGAYVTWAVIARRRAGVPQLAASGGGSPELSSRLSNLERSLDAIAVEVERVGEGQRFMTRLFSERGERKKDDA